MRRMFILGSALALLGLMAVSCGGPSQMVETWADPTYTPQIATNVMVVGLGENQRRVSSFEDIMASHFAARKVTVEKGSVSGATGSADIEGFKRAVIASGAQIVTVTRLVDVASETVYHPGTTAYVPAAGYYGMGAYYHSSYMMVSDPGYVSESKIYKVETNVYDVKTEKLIWSGLSHTTDPSNFQEAVNSIAELVVGEMIKMKIVP